MSEGPASREDVSRRLPKTPEAWRVGRCVASGQQTDPPDPGAWGGCIGQGVPAEEHKAGLTSKGFSSLIFCDSASVLGDGFLCQP